MNFSDITTTVSYSDYKATVRSYFRFPPNLVLSQEREINKKEYFNPIENKYRWDSYYDTIIQRVFVDKKAGIQIRVDLLAKDTAKGEVDYYPLDFRVSYTCPNTKTLTTKDYIIHYPTNFFVFCG